MAATGAKRSGEPVNRMSRLADAACAVIEAHPESDGSERGIILLAGDGEGGNLAFGFDDDSEVISFLLAHLEAICKATGYPLVVGSLDQN